MLHFTLNRASFTQKVAYVPLAEGYFKWHLMLDSNPFQSNQACAGSERSRHWKQCSEMSWCSVAMALKVNEQFPNHSVVCPWRVHLFPLNDFKWPRRREMLLSRIEAQKRAHLISRLCSLLLRHPLCPHCNGHFNKINNVQWYRHWQASVT